MYFLTNLRRAERCLADWVEVFYCPLRGSLCKAAPRVCTQATQGSPNVAFHEPAPKLACYLLWQLPRRVSSVVPNLLSKKKKSIWAVLFLTFGPSSRFLSLKPSFLDDYLTTKHSDFSIFLVIYLTDKPVDRSIHAYALV